MTVAVELSETIVSDATIVSKVCKRSLGDQIEYWARIGKIAEENPDMTYDFIKNILIAEQEALAEHLEPYNFGDK